MPSNYSRSGYDRGHLAPAEDMKFSEVTMRDSFYMSNMSPLIATLLRKATLRVGGYDLKSHSHLLGRT